jgi:dTMP kinase
MTGRYQGDESKKDIHESNTAYLDRSQLAARHCAKVLGWKTILCVKDGAMRDIDDIGREILANIGL